jgi:hypothetical protein
MRKMIAIMAVAVFVVSLVATILVSSATAAAPCRYKCLNGRGYKCCTVNGVETCTYDPRIDCIRR